MKTKKCCTCKRIKRIKHFSKNNAIFDGFSKQCKLCEQNRKLKHRYGTNNAEYKHILKSQDYKCAICLKSKTSKALHVDHDHISKKIRGILCFSCNVSLGYLKDDIELLSRAVIYLHKSNKQGAA